MIEASSGWLLIVAFLAALPLLALRWARARSGEPLPRVSGRLFLLYALFFSLLLMLLRWGGEAAVLGPYGFALAFLGTQRGLGPVYRLLYGRDYIVRHPSAVAMDSQRLHLLFWIAAVSAIALGLVFATRPTPVTAQEPESRIHLPLLLRAFEGAFPTAQVPPSTTPTLSPSPTAEDTVTPTLTSTPEPSPTPKWPDWLARVNQHRALAGLAPVSENPDWSRGGEAHSRYMVKEDRIDHVQDMRSRWYSAEGDAAARNGNIHVSADIDRQAPTAVDFWMVGPFHQLGIIDPELSRSGFGEYREDIGRFHYGATLDVIRGLGAAPPDQEYPVRYPEEGEELLLLSYRGGESPDPLTGCPGYAPPTGPPIVLMIGGGSEEPQVSLSHFYDADGGELTHCVFDETSYRNGDLQLQRLGRGILDSRDAIILIPRAPLTAGSEYSARIVNRGEVHEWRFGTREGRAEANAGAMARFANLLDRLGQP